MVVREKRERVRNLIRKRTHAEGSIRFRWLSNRTAAQFPPRLLVPFTIFTVLFILSQSSRFRHFAFQDDIYSQEKLNKLFRYKFSFTVRATWATDCQL